MAGIAISTAPFEGYDWQTAFRTIAEAGATRVEPAFIGGYSRFSEDDFNESAAYRLAGEARRDGLTIPAVSAHIDLGAPDAGEMLARRLRFAGACGARYLVTNAGFSRDINEISSQIERALPLCEELDVVLALENPGHGSGAAVYDAASGKALAGRFQHPRLRLNYDAGNVFSYSKATLQPAEDLARHGFGLIGYMHIKDLAPDGDDWIFCAIGDGLVDYDALFGLIPPDMPISLELPLHLYRPQRSDPTRKADALSLAKIKRALETSLTRVKASGRPAH